jgi:predicted small secreted protein
MAVISLSACNTVKGAGRDVSATGRAVTGAATHVEKDLKN